MKGLVGSILTLAGFGIIFFLFWMSFMEVVDVHGGYDAFMQMVADDPTTALNLFKYEFARDMLVPLYPVEVPVFGQIFIPFDDLSPFFIVAISSILCLVIWKASGLRWGMLLIIPIVFMVISTLWLSIWTGLMFQWGNEIGMTDEVIYNDMMASQDLFDVHPAIYWLSLLGAGFVFWRGKRLIKV